ncbi:L-ribulose-5-phosphate 4-epimerase [Clostridium folliculivorans]|uniref:L-ribulose-5-phosphate 4-epimerase n=1 Tax=Clostridium folliculivorans TaxID=2886038 RepID=A0A9W5Y177_9CLOT|nr:L-ribulose-5-phosphate 4-epimerase [Clostridium folliculivorans]GKU24864.1 L-ribulose-5-phosphate 4-epimerase UlaF [Clostridium folliculivorans]GKU30962.1 L-ribulose-5-phosphate 4-epimerase UlaF [Clostridium folliculivorans]
MLEELKKQVLEANLMLPQYNLVKFTWGNVSGIDREKNLIVIKPSGVPYEELTIDKLVVLDLEGNIVEGDLRPSSDTPTHIELYKRYKDMGGIVHTHSTWATIWAQASMEMPALGTTHADHFYGNIPCTRKLTEAEIAGDYEGNTGKVIIETLGDREVMAIPGVLVSCHAPFTWGKTPKDAVVNSVVLEETCNMAYHTVTLNKEIGSLDQFLLDKHYYRKHGSNAYYGQK